MVVLAPPSGNSNRIRTVALRLRQPVCADLLPAAVEASEHIITVQSVHAEARKRGLFFQQLDSAPLRGRSVEIAGRPLVSFASCSYLGLEHHPKLVSAVHEAVDRYGTQFSASRGYLSAPEYTRLEDLLGEIFEGHVLVTPSTTLGHAAALPVLVTERDAIVMDHQVSASCSRAGGTSRTPPSDVEGSATFKPSP